MTELPESDAEFIGLLASVDDNAAELARQTGVNVDRIKRRRAKLRPPIEEAPEPWGLGGPGTLNLPAKDGDYTVVGIFDLHGDRREEKLFQAQLRHIREVQPDLVVLGGDTVNFDIISRWQDKILKRMAPIAILKEIRREIDDAKHIRQQVRDAAGDALVIETEGNHCDRLRKYLSDDLQEGWETAKEWMGVDDQLDGYFNRAGVFIRDRFLVRHGDTCAQNPAKKEYSMSRCSGWTGHLHKVHQHYEPPFPYSGENYVHTIAPASCRLDANYGSGNAGLMGWHQGNLIGTFSASDPHDHHTDIGRWMGGKLLVRGERY